MAKARLSSAAPVALLQPKAMTLAAVIELITADTSLLPPRRQNIIWGLKLGAKAAGRSAEQISASLATLRTLTAGFHPEHAGLSRKSWRNAQSCIVFAFKHLGLTRIAAPRRLLPAWQHLLDSMGEAGLKDWHLQRLARCCSAHGIVPEEVSDATLPLYHRILVEESLRKDPDRVVRRTAQVWNKARRLVPGWPIAEFAIVNRAKSTSLPLEVYPASFQTDVADFLKRISSSSPFGKGQPNRPVTAATLRQRRYQIRGLASALVTEGIPAESIKRLAALVQPKHIKLALEFIWRRNGERNSSHVHGHAIALLAIAKYHVRVPAKTRKELRDIAARLAPEQRGMTARNSSRLRQLDDSHNKALLLHLPARLRVEAEGREKPDQHGALLLQMAVAIELLTLCLLRRGNLVRLDADRHFRWSRAGRTGVCHLAIEAAEVKNRAPLEFELPQETADLLKLYLDLYQPLLGTASSSWLFPSRTGRTPKNESGFSAQIADCILSRTGLAINPHLFRHIGAKLHLDAEPGSYEVLRRVFGHRSMATTAETYCGLEMMAAARHVDSTILTQRKATRPLLLRRNRRRPTKPVQVARPGKPAGKASKPGPKGE